MAFFKTRNVYDPHDCDEYYILQQFYYKTSLEEIFY